MTEPVSVHNSYKSKSGLHRIINATRYSFDGLRAAFRYESAFRQELALAAILIPVALLTPVSGVGKALMVGAVMLVLIVELINSAIEAVVDRISIEDHPLAKRAKDIGSAVVFLSLVNAGLVWILVLF